jgi:hypothetical protein
MKQHNQIILRPKLFFNAAWMLRRYSADFVYLAFWDLMSRLDLRIHLSNRIAPAAIRSEGHPGLLQYIYVMGIPIKYIPRHSRRIGEDKKSHGNMGFNLHGVGVDT